MKLKSNEKLRAILVRRLDAPTKASFIMGYRDAGAWMFKQIYEMIDSAVDAESEHALAVTQGIKGIEEAFNRAALHSIRTGDDYEILKGLGAVSIMYNEITNA